MSSNNWNPAIRLIHWLMAAIAIVCVSSIWLHEIFPKGDPLRTSLVLSHFTFGAMIFVFTAIRVFVRLSSKSPNHELSKGVKLISKLTHFSIYAVMISLPIFGYLAVSGKGDPINLLLNIQIPAASVGKDVGHLFKEVHEALGTAFVVLVSLHVAAALYHALFIKDKVLQSMLGRAEK